MKKPIDPSRPVIIEGPVERGKVRFTKLLRADGSTFTVTARRQSDHRNPLPPISIVEVDPPSGARRMIWIARTADRAWHESLDQLEETA